MSKGILKSSRQKPYNKIFKLKTKENGTNYKAYENLKEEKTKERIKEHPLIVSAKVSANDLH